MTCYFCLEHFAPKSQQQLSTRMQRMVERPEVEIGQCPQCGGTDWALTFEELNHFMGKLGKLIDAGNADGIEVEYLNPLLDTMKKLSENVITYQPKRKGHHP